MKYSFRIVLILFLGLSTWAQEKTIPLQQRELEPWVSFHLEEAVQKEQLLGRVSNAAASEERLALWRSKSPLRLGKSGGRGWETLGAASPRAAAEDPARAATQLSAPPHQMEGFLALADNNVNAPPDCAGAVSPDHVVTVLNSDFRVQDRQGRVLRTLSIGRFFGAAGPFSLGVVEPRIAWDQAAKRWVVAGLADPRGSTPALVLAISANENPLGDWRVTRLLNPGAVGLSFASLRMALAGPFLLVSTNVFLRDEYDSTRNSIFLLSDLYAARSTVQQFEDFLFTNTPVEDNNRQATRAIFANLAFGVFDLSLRFVIREVRLANNVVAVQERVVATAGDADPRYLSSIMPQLGSQVLIDGGDTDLQNCVARGDDVYCVGTLFQVYGTTRTAMLQVYQFNRANLPTVPAVGRIRIDDPNFANFYGFPSIAVNKNKDIFIGYNRFRSDRYASAHFAVRRVSDPTAGYYFDGLLKAGESYYRKGTLLTVPWGSYSSTVVDPVDDTSFWTLQEYAASRTEADASQWGTWWTKFEFRNTPCTFRLDRTNADVGFAPLTLRVSLTTNTQDCKRILASNASWISSTAVSAPLGNATFEFQIGLNRGNLPRSGTISIGDQTFTVNQAANPTPPPQEPVLNVTRVEAPLTARVGDSVSVSASVKNVGSRGAGTFRIAYYLSSRTPVTNKDIFSGFGCVIQQGLVSDESTECTGNFQVATDIAPGVYYLAAIADDREQLTMSDRSGAVRVSDAGTITIRAAANAPSFAGGGLVNGASARAGAVAPGLIFVLYGSRLGPAALTTLALDANGRVATTLAGTQVFFDGVAAPLIYTSGGQVSGIVPYSVAGKTTVRVEAVLNGLRSDAVVVPVNATAPALFSVDFSGQNQVAALNEDGSVNSAAQPAEAGKLIVLYGTGAGTFRTQPVDGAVIGLPLPEYLNTLSLEIGGQTAELLYAGPAPGLVSGVFQINARVPAGVSGDRVSVLVRSGSNASLAGTTIAVK